MKLSRGFKNFLGFVFALSALYGITSKPDFFEIIVAVGCVVIAVLLFKPTEAEKAAKAEKAANAARVGNKANTPTVSAENLAESANRVTRTDSSADFINEPVKPIVEHYSRNNDVVHLKCENALLREQLSPDQDELVDAKLETIKIQNKNQEAKAELSKTEEQLKKAKEQLIETEEAVLLQSFGLYTPHFDFMRADDYKAKLLEIRARQKDAVKDGLAVTGSSAWSIDGNQAKGRKMISDMQKLLLRAFNAECDDVVEHVRYNNIEASEKRITSSRDAISKLGQTMGIGITSGYYKLKIDELHLAFEWQEKKQREKEEQREARAEMREAAKLARELEAERRKLEKEQSHYENALAKLNEQLATASEADQEAIAERKAQIEKQLEKIDTAFRDVDYREANQRAGYVYIISNIGAFGENVYKIGMTRRLDPMDRIDELGDASVPFKFDVHAMIFSEDAPGLEAALHNAFADKKLNFVNQRREFFNVSLDEIKKVVRDNYDKSVEFIETPPAEQYRESLLLREAAGTNV